MTKKTCKIVLSVNPQTHFKLIYKNFKHLFIDFVDLLESTKRNIVILKV